MFSFIDLFSGIGGFRLASERLGGHCIGFSEINKDAIDTYKENYDCSNEEYLGDITLLNNLPTHDLLTAGVPCQSWSIAGKNLGFFDDRGQLWNDTLYLLNTSRPKAFIFENVKGLSDPRNKEALDYIMKRIHDAGYYANYYILNAFDYGVLQNRVRIYIIGFRDKEFFLNFQAPLPVNSHQKLFDIIDNDVSLKKEFTSTTYKFSYTQTNKVMSISANENGQNDYFLFNDIRDGHSTIHSWDILETTDKEKNICQSILKNRRKSKYGLLDGNPLSLKHIQELIPSVELKDLDKLVNIGILREVDYSFKISNENQIDNIVYDDLMALLIDKIIIKSSLDQLKTDPDLKAYRHKINTYIQMLIEKSMITCVEKRYEFKNSKISTGLFGINRIFLQQANVFSTLVASDSYDYIATVPFEHDKNIDYKEQFIQEVFKQKKYRRVNKSEACRIQGFPAEFIMPENRSRWMKLLGNSVSIPVIEKLIFQIIRTGVFNSSFSDIGETLSPLAKNVT